MASSSSRVRSKRQRRSREISILNSEFLTDWIVDRLPHTFSQALQYLTRSQLQLLIVSLILLFIPLVATHPAIWQQGILGLFIIAVGRLILHLDERESERRKDGEIFQTNSELRTPKRR